MKKLILALFPMVILSCGHKIESSFTENEKEIIKSELQSIMSQIIQNYETGNMEKAIEPYLDSPDFMSISNGQISDYQKYMIENKYYFEALESQRSSKSKMIYTFLNKETVVITWSCSVYVQMKNEQELKIEPYAATFIFKNVNDSWKVIYTHGSGEFIPINKDSNLTK